MSPASAGYGEFGVNLSGAELGIAGARRTQAGRRHRRSDLDRGQRDQPGDREPGAGGVTATVGNLSLAISQSFGQAVNGPNSTRGPPLDWSADLSLDGGQTYGGAQKTSPFRAA